MAIFLKLIRTGSVFFLLLTLFIFTACSHRLEKRKKNSRTHYKLGVVYYNDGNIPDALKELTIAVDRYPVEPSYHVALGLAYFARGLDSDAKEHMREAIRLDKDFSEARVNLAAIYIKEKDWDNAIKECSEALKNLYYKTPEVAYLNMGWAYYNKGLYHEAIERFKKATALKPDMPPAYYNMGLSFEKTNSIKDAVGAYRKAVGLNDRYLDAYYRLGLALIKEKDKEGALVAFQRVIELAPGSDRAGSAKDYIKIMK